MKKVQFSPKISICTLVILLFSGCVSERENPVHVAVKNGDLESLLLLIENGASIEALDKRGYTPLMTAAEIGNEEVARILLKRGALVKAKSSSGNTPLLRALAFDKEEMVRLLIVKDANVNLANDRGTTPLHLTVRSSDKTNRLLLLAGADPNIGNYRGSTPLMRAALYNRVDLISLYLENGARINNTDNKGDTALHYACSATNRAFSAAQLLIISGAEVDRKNSNGATPLVPCVIHGTTNLVRFLIDPGASVNVEKTSNGWTPLMYAVDMMDAEITALLLKAGADKEICGISEITGRRWCAMDSALESEDETIIELIRGNGSRVNKSLGSDLEP